MRLLGPLLCVLCVSGAQTSPQVGSGSLPAPASGDLTLRRDPAPDADVRAALRGLPSGVRTGVLVQDLTSRQVVLAVRPDEAFIPASTTKLVTAAAVLAERGGALGWWSAELTVPALQAGQATVKAVTLRGSGDPTLSVSGGGYSLRALAKQAFARGLRTVGEVRLEDARLDPASWKAAPIGVPMTALRLSEWRGSPPRSAAEARGRLGAALIAELRRAGVTVASERVGQAASFSPYLAPPRTDDRGRSLPPDPWIPPARRPEHGVASVRSASPAQVVAATLRPSDNLRAEELLSTLALRPAANGTLAGALARERAFLGRIGVNLSGVTLADGSGLSRGDHLTPRALVDLLRVMHDLPYAGSGPAALPATLYRERRNAFIEALAQGGTGENVPAHDGRGGTLARRFLNAGLDVRAKTGTLPGVSALAGYVTARSGHTLAFAILMNGPEDSPILTLRAVQDAVVGAVAAAH
ncbi:D-alanyl-D-alanine carboxypeptidase/D-alanyl-D-alanine-endopeptidase [Deinococcus aerophilus]|uniref:D-alanyl-D-alanine carboxypeptidase n=1 Tax=Deinococcus aerophilus TaxID=522488 RepID=A0ABQ2GVB7_9DEIO|nr:D-alanyl-D-alanine carboxypeptidase [Deinococcus aerophilus]GGM12647.1 D-alanyl-D-alanine carboxypeptidase [Deinococcus aerophilus]